jgi:hypothetical protein
MFGRSGGQKALQSWQECKFDHEAAADNTAAAISGQPCAKGHTREPQALAYAHPRC